MPGRCQSGARIALTFLVLSLSVSAVRAEGLLEFLFGGFNDSWPKAAPAYNPSRPLTLTVRPRYTAFGRGTVFCVRTCDGRYFPLPRSATAQPAQICSSLCPASKTKVFSGSEISSAVAADGSRYAALDHAFLYRKEAVENCTCNGVTHYGLATLDARDDPTLRPGDLIATGDGVIKSTDLMKMAQKTAASRDEDIATSSLPMSLRGSSPGDLPRTAKPATIPAR
jgi:hypothetical protein